MKKCPYCVGFGNYFLKNKSRSFYRCQNCDLIFEAKYTEIDKVLSTYKNEYFKQYSVEQTAGFRDELFEHILNVIEKVKDTGRLLDVGTGCGNFLMVSKKRGWKAKGIDPSKESIEAARKLDDVDIFQGTLREYQGCKPFDVVTFLNVLEHVTEPWKEIERSFNLLKSDGIIFIRFPNGYIHSQIHRIASKIGIADDIRKFLVFHRFCFTPKFINRLLSDTGFSNIVIVNSVPSKGDPYKLLPHPILISLIKKIFSFFAFGLETLSHQKILIGPSIEVLAAKKNS